jgi:hypothetical protein
MATAQQQAFQPRVYNTPWVSIAISTLLCGMRPFTTWAQIMDIASSPHGWERNTGLLHDLHVLGFSQFLFIPAGITLVLALAHSFRGSVLPQAKGVLWLLFIVAFLNCVSFFAFVFSTINKTPQLGP